MITVVAGHRVRDLRVLLGAGGLLIGSVKTRLARMSILVFLLQRGQL